MSDKLSKFGSKAKGLFKDLKEDLSESKEFIKDYKKEFTEDLKESTGEAKVFLKDFKDEFVSMTEGAVEFVEKKFEQIEEEQKYDYTIDMANDPDKHIHETNRDR